MTTPATNPIYNNGSTADVDHLDGTGPMLWVSSIVLSNQSGLGRTATIELGEHSGTRLTIDIAVGNLGDGETYVLNVNAYVNFLNITASGTNVRRMIFFKNTGLYNR